MKPYIMLYMGRIMYSQKSYMSWCKNQHQIAYQCCCKYKPFFSMRLPCFDLSLCERKTHSSVATVEHSGQFLPNILCPFKFCCPQKIYH